MTKTRWVGLLTTLFVAALAVAAAASGTIFAEETEYDFGAVLEGYSVSHVFVLQNVGDSTLEIVRVRTSCGCTTTDLATRFLEPGESVDLEVLLDTAGFGGSISKSIYVESSDPDTPRLTLRMFGVVNRAQPYHISVGDMNYLFYLLIDVRDPDAYAAGHLMGAINIPYAELNDWIPRLPNGVLMILYDQTGEQSDLAAQMLQGAGFPEARSLLGGLNEWTRQFEEKFIFPFAE
jgi:rhodanese-related sulfurtransferase